MDTVSGLTAHDEIWVDSASGTDEFTMVSAIGTLQITARLFAAKSASDILYRQDDIIDLLFYRRIALLSASSDVTLLPGDVDRVLLHYAAYKGFARLELFDESEKHFKIWERDIAEAWLSSGKNSTGAVTTFSV